MLKQSDNNKQQKFGKIYKIFAPKAEQASYGEMKILRRVEFDDDAAEFFRWSWRTNL